MCSDQPNDLINISLINMEDIKYCAVSRNKIEKEIPYFSSMFHFNQNNKSDIVMNIPYPKIAKKNY